MRILLLDLDGTIRCSTTGNFIESPQGQKAMLGADRAIKYYASKGWKIAGISNQGGIASGYKSLDVTIEEMQVTLGLFPQLQFILFCPDFEGKKCVIVERERFFKYSTEDEEGWKKTGNIKQDICFRKPGAGMLNAAIEILTKQEVNDFMLNTYIFPEFECWFVGDRQEDEQAAFNFGCEYLDAQHWRNRFLPGMHELPNATPAQIRFLEGIELN